ncbi:MAG: hypothetical protein ACLVJ6_15385, partial [Merdibacter sp.]
VFSYSQYEPYTRIYEEKRDDVNIIQRKKLPELSDSLCLPYRAALTMMSQTLRENSIGSSTGNPSMSIACV